MPNGDSSSLDRFFSGLSEYVFHSQLGVVDTQLVGYVSELLIRFIRVDTQTKVRQVDGKPAMEVVTMVDWALWIIMILEFHHRLVEVPVR